MEEGDDDPHLDLEGEWEMHAYNLIKNREFIHTPTYHLDLLEKIGMALNLPPSRKPLDGRTLLPLTSKVLAS